MNELLINNPLSEPWEGYKSVFAQTPTEIIFFSILTYKEAKWHQQAINGRLVEITCLPYGFSYKILDKPETSINILPVNEEKR